MDIVKKRKEIRADLYELLLAKILVDEVLKRLDQHGVRIWLYSQQIGEYRTYRLIEGE